MSLVPRFYLETRRCRRVGIQENQRRIEHVSEYQISGISWGCTSHVEAKHCFIVKISYHDSIIIVLRSVILLW